MYMGSPKTLWAYLKYQRILKSPWDSGTQQVWVYPEKFNIDFLSLTLFLTSIGIYMGSPNKLWAKNTRKKFSPEFFQKKSCSLNPVTPTRNC